MSLPTSALCKHINSADNAWYGFETCVRLAQDEPSLPASLAALRLSSSYAIDVGELTRGVDRLRMAAEPVLDLDSAIECSLEGVVGHALPPCTVASHASRLAGTLPVGFRALQLRAHCVFIHCSVAVQWPTPAAVAEQLLLFFAHAPPSYRRFSLCCKDYLLMYLALSWPPGSGWLGRTRAQVAYDNLAALAVHLRSCAVVHDMSVEAVQRRAPGFDCTTTLTLRRL